MQEVNGTYINDYESKAYRPLTFAERKVNFTSIEKLTKNLDKVLLDKLANIMPMIIAREDKQKIIDRLSDVLTSIWKEAFDIWKKSASSEMKVKEKATSKKILWAMKIYNTNIASNILDEIYKSLEKQWFSEKWIIGRFFQWMKTLFITATINLWRETVREQYPEKVYAFQYSAILDWVTTPLCRSLDWKIVKANSSAYKSFSPPNHWGCRSIWVEILQEETYKPKITWIDNLDWEDTKIQKDYKKTELDYWLVTQQEEIQNLL